MIQTERRDDLHVAIIMDGNGRWATGRGLPRVAGHRAGVTAARRVVERAPDVGIRRLTLYAFSSDNWSRPDSEVRSIFWLLRAFLRLETQRMCERGVHLQVIGRRDRLEPSVLREIERAEKATAHGRHLDLRVAIDYSSRHAIALAAVGAAMFLQGAPSSDVLVNVPTHDLIAETNDVDLLIRTGGEKRLSDFLLWESAYAELLFTDRMWPEFDDADLDAAVEDFQHRQRRFGALPSSSLSNSESTAKLASLHHVARHSSLTTT
jgi:undecaprenyl diphosphate synthase